MENKLISFAELETKTGLSKQMLFNYAKKLKLKRVKRHVGGHYKYFLNEDQVKELEKYRNNIKGSQGKINIKYLDIDSYLNTSFGLFSSKIFSLKTKAY
ncbi:MULTISPECIES: hypothetical protein [unclassified Francisella]|uniref:hypothetical protein n=1 Tax=unclassified Francisella TaxID=2610885 RepID=UPI002E34CA4A|nr:MULTISPECIES: hypothetical protein [unclassified Francisella]MED7818916.1 hypothetical protein [Francisella sp. 19S2-4]MED7829753.1 hypothetical protein [Francisella sp. 19S2-10]